MSSIPAASPAPPPKSKPAPSRLGLLIALIVLATFAPICRHGFLAYDDDRTIQYNPRIAQPSVENVLHYWRHAYMDMYAPLTYTAWSGLAVLSHGFTEGDSTQLDPAIFHAASVLLHAINALLVFALLRRLIKHAWAAAGGAMLFALHPVQVETVAWASGLKDLLCATFSLLALVQYVLSVAPPEPDEPQPGARRRRIHFVLSLTAMLLGMLCKPTAMITPVLAAIVDLLILKRPWRRVLASVAPMFALAVPCVIWTKLCQPSGFRRVVAIWQRPLIATDTLAFYLFKLIFPAHLTYDYGRTPRVAIEKGWAYWTWIAPASVAVALLVARRRAAPLAAGGLLLVAGIAPVLGFFVFDFQVISTVADHYLYLAMLGPAFAAGWAMSRMPRDYRVAAATTLILGLLAARSVDQQRYWHDDQRFFAHALQINPESWGSYFALATVAHNRAQDLASDRPAADQALREAMDLYRQTLRVNPNHLAAEHGYATILLHFGRFQEAAEVLADIVRRRDRLPPAGRVQFYRDTDLLGQCYFRLGRFSDAVDAFRDATQLTPPPPGAHEHLQQAQHALGVARTTTGIE